MGWVIRLNADRDIQEKDVNEILEAMPQGLRTFHGLPMSKQSWGWTAAVDVSNPEGSTLKLSGSYSASGLTARSFADHMQSELEKRGYIMQPVDKSDF